MTELRTDFAHDSATAVPIVVPDARGLSPADLDQYAADLSRVSDVSAVSAPTGTFVGGNRVGPPAAATGLADGSAFLTVSSTAPLFSRALRHPAHPVARRWPDPPAGPLRWPVSRRSTATASTP